VLPYKVKIHSITAQPQKDNTTLAKPSRSCDETVNWHQTANTSQIWDTSTHQYTCKI